MLVLSRVAAFCFLLSWTMLPGINFSLAQEKIDINTAPIEELVKIIHIGEARAQELISLRPFSSVDDMVRIKGIGQSRIEDIKNQGLAFVQEEVYIENIPETEKEEQITPEIKTEPVKEVYFEPIERTEGKLIATIFGKDRDYRFWALPIMIISAALVLLLKKSVKIS